MRLSLTLTAALLAAFVAGCLGGPGETMTAREGLDDARSAANDWADGQDLELLGVVAIEPFKHIRYESDDGEYEAEYVTHLDGNPGDGRAPGWAYGFYTGERCVSVVLAAGIGVLAEGYETCDGDLDALPEWSVDSDEVAEILGGEEEWPDLGDDGTYFWGLHGEDGMALWVVAGTGEDGETVFASVDASSGEVLAIAHEAEGDIEAIFEAEAQAEAAGQGGSAMATDNQLYMIVGDELVAEVDLGGMSAMQIGFNANLMALPMQFVVEGPYGVVEEGEIGGNLAVGNPQETHNLDDLPEGHYTVTLTAQGAAALATLSVYAEW
ncbi:MAG: hypothetical protein ACYC2H_08805 [Thermoplasmatota archaeon]